MKGVSVPASFLSSLCVLLGFDLKWFYPFSYFSWCVDISKFEWSQLIFLFEAQIMFPVGCFSISFSGLTWWKEEAIEAVLWDGIPLSSISSNSHISFCLFLIKICLCPFVWHLWPWLTLHEATTFKGCTSILVAMALGLFTWRDFTLDLARSLSVLTLWEEAQAW